MCWSPPPQGFHKLNCDGAVSGAGAMAGCRGILRDASGKFIFAFSHKLEPCSVLEAELWAIYHGLSLAWGRGFRNIIIDSDSINAVKLLSEGCDQLHPCLHLVRGMKSMIVQPADIRWSHIWREANQIADILAKESTTLPFPCKIHDVAPPSLFMALIADGCGTVFPRGF